MKNIFALILVLPLLAGCANTAPQAGTPDQKPPARTEGIKPYADVVTREAKSDSGVFVVHRVKQKWFFEIPKKELGKEFLLVSSQARTQTGIGYGGDNLNSQVVKWERNNDRILLRSVYYAAVSADSLPVAYSVAKATLPPILMALDIQAYNRDSSAVVVDVSDLFTSDMTELGLGRFQRDQYRVRRLDGKRSFVEKIRSFPDNLEVEATLTYDAGSVPGDNDLSTLTLLVHHSMVRLPERPMIPRLYDERVGYFGVSKVDYGYDAQRAERRRFISRWRLEPRDPAAIARGELVEPVKPITFYIDRGVPDKWRPYLHRGVEMWQPAFEDAGFQKAIIALDPPSVKADSDWSSEDARYATIRWLPSDIENAYGPHISDPRTGEILDADIGLYHNVMNLARNWYFVQAGPSDPRARVLPLPDSLMGEFLAYIVAHEVGHSLGFPHNMKGSSQFPVDSLRSPSFTRKWGTEASIMDYGRFNYVAQPGDGATLIPKLGPYDYLAAEWGYRPFPTANTPEDEKPFLEKIVSRQEREPYLRFGDADGIDPTAQTEDLGGDPIAATMLGMKNLARVSDMLLTATTKEGEDYSTLREMYTQVFGQRNRELGHVAGLIGGVVSTRRVAGQVGAVYEPVPRARQKAAMAYLQQEGFRVPTELVRPELLRLFEPTGAADRVLAGHRQLLTTLLDNARLGRLITHSAVAYGTEKVYTAGEMLEDLRKGIWKELGVAKVNVELMRRNLQRTYLDVLGTKLNPPPFVQPAGLPAGITIPPPPALPGEARALIRQELLDLDASIAKAISSAGDRETKAHLRDSHDRIQKILFPEK